MMKATIDCTNGKIFCAGFGPKSTAQLALVSDLPIPPPSNARIVYTWTADHPNQNWTWGTGAPEQSVPIRWPGEYIIQVKITYYLPNRTPPFAAFWSNKVAVNGENC